MSEYFRIDEPKFWHDFGPIFCAGFEDGTDENGAMLLMRTGPFVPPISFPPGGCVVTDEFRRLLTDRWGSEVSFLPVVKYRVVFSEWEKWDRTIDLPAHRLPECEPEDIVLCGDHDNSLANAMPELWQLVAPPVNIYWNDVNGESVFDGPNSDFEHRDICRKRAGWHRLAGFAAYRCALAQEAVLEEDASEYLLWQSHLGRFQSESTRATQRFQRDSRSTRPPSSACSRASHTYTG